MDWKLPDRNIFWVPFPAPVDTNKWEPLKIVEINDLKQNKTVKLKVLDWHGAYNIDSLPSSISRDCTDKPEISGDLLSKFLQEKKPEFKDAKLVLFYQLTRIPKND